MENNNDDGVAKVNLAKSQAELDQQDTVHKVNLGAPTSTEETEENQIDDASIGTETEGANQQINGSDEDSSGQSNDIITNDSTVGVTDSNSDSSSDANSEASDSDSDSSSDANSEASDSSSDREDGVLEEITDEDDTIQTEGSEDSDADITSTEETTDAPVYPENIQKLVDFVNETGGTIEDYVKLNVDIDSLDEDQILRDYHASLEPLLDSEELDIIMEDLYNGDEDDLTDRELKRQSIAKKRDLSKAKKHLQETKDKYYDEIKAGSSLTPDQKKAVDFFNRHNEAQEEDQKSRTQKQKIFTDKTNKLFDEEFKGFEFKVGEKRYRYNVKDVKGTKSAQSDIQNFTKKYLGDDNSLKDEKGYHKALFTAMNADAIADHFYKQGQADAIKSSAASKKNIDMGGRKNHGKAVPATGGMKARVVAVDKGPSSGTLKFKSFSKG